MIRPLPLILLSLLASVLATAQDTEPFLGAPPPSSLFEGISRDQLPDNWYAWNLLATKENWYNKSLVSTETNWTQNANTPPAGRVVFGRNSVTMAFFKPTENEDGSKNYMYSNLLLDFTPLTLGGLYVESGALGTTAKSSNPKLSSFSMLSNANPAIRYLNILSREDEEILSNQKPGESLEFESIAARFEINEDFSFGGTAASFTGVNIYSSWDLSIARGKTLSLYGEMLGGQGKTITLSQGGNLLLSNTNQLLFADWVLKDNSTLRFSKDTAGMSSTNLLGNGKIIIEATGGRLILSGDNNINIANNIEIREGGTFTVLEQARNTYSKESVVWINVTGNVSGKGDWMSASEGGQNATNETWLFTGDNSGFYGNWITTADVDYAKDKVYSFMPMVFGNGGIFQWDGVDENAFYKIAGHGAIIGGIGQVSRKGMPVGFNYNSDVIIFNDIRDYAKVKHLSSSVLELRGTNTHVYGTYAEAGGTIRFSKAENLGSLNDVVLLADGIKEGVTGSSIILNNNSGISFSGSGTETIKNALFNTSGSWNISVEQASATLKWDMSRLGLYDLGASSAESGKRTGAFTKKGEGTLDVTAGELLTSTNTIFVEQGTLAFSGTGTWGKVNKIILDNGTTLRSDRDMQITSGLTLTTSKTSHVPTFSTVDGNLALNSGGIMEFVMGGAPEAEGAPPLFNVFDINGNFTINATGENQGIFQFSFLNGFYVSQEGFYKLLTANNDLRTLDLSKIKLEGLDETNSRQKYQLYASGTTGWKDKFGNIKKESFGAEDGSELYLYASPDAAILTWNKSTGGDWVLVGDDSARESWRGHDTDTRFYNNDTVIFGDNEGDSDPKTINLVSDITPAKVTVTGSSHYVFSSENNSKIVGQGSLVKEGPGTLDIYTSNTYVGGTHIFEGTINAYAQSSFGSGMIRQEGGQLNIRGTEALGTADIMITGGELNIYSTNSAQRNATLNGGTIYAYGSNSLGNGTLLVQKGSVYARGDNAIGGNVIITGEGSHLYTQFANALGNTTVTVANGGMVHSAINPDPSWTMGAGSSIILSDGGILEVNSSTALNELSSLKFNGGELRVDNRKVDATGFHGVLELVNTKQAIINTIGNDSQLKLSGQLGKMVNADILKIGSGELLGVLVGDFRARLDIQEGKGHLRQDFVVGSTTEYTKYIFNGKLAGVGIMEFSGGSINVTADMIEFDGTLLVNLDQSDFTLSLADDHIRGPRALYDVILNKGSISIADSSGENILFWGNLASGDDAEANQSTIGFGKDQLAETVRAQANIQINQTQDEEFKGSFVNGGTQGTLTTSVNKLGSATLTLSNDSTTLGTLTISEGVIRLGNGGSTGHWNGKIINNSSLVMNYGNTVKTYDKEISGTGSVDITTGDTVVFTAKNSYTGGTRISNGTVLLDNEGTLGEGEITMSGRSTLNVANGKGVENRTIRVASNSSATIKTAALGEKGILTTASADNEQAAISVKGGQLDDVTLVVLNGKATLSGSVSGSAAISLDASVAGQSPLLNNISLGAGSMATASNGTSSISSRLALSYGADSITGTAGNREIVDAKLSIGNAGSYDLSQMNQLSLNIDQNAILSLGDDQKFTIHIFGKGADLSQVFSGDSTTGLSNIVLDSFLRTEGWNVSKESLSGDSAWWKTGAVVLEKGGAVPEPSSAALLLAGALLAGMRRKRRA